MRENGFKCIWIIAIVSFIILTNLFGDIIYIITPFLCMLLYPVVINLMSGTWDTAFGHVMFWYRYLYDYYLISSFFWYDTITSIYSGQYSLGWCSG